MIDQSRYDRAIWVDVNNDYQINVDPELLLDTKAINGSLRNLLRCPLGARRMQREYGTRLPFFLYEPCTQITADSLFSSLVQSIARWEPRIVLDVSSSRVRADLSLPGYQVSLAYTVKRTDATSLFQFSVRKF